MPLTDTQIKGAKPESKPRKLADEKGLYLLLQPTGGKLWRLKYRFEGKEKLLALGAYPEVGLKEARARREEARKLLAEGKAQKAASEACAANSFEVIGREWQEKWRSTAQVRLPSQRRAT